MGRSMYRVSNFHILKVNYDRVRSELVGRRDAYMLYYTVFIFILNYLSHAVHQKMSRRQH